MWPTFAPLARNETWTDHSHATELEEVSGALESALDTWLSQSAGPLRPSGRVLGEFRLGDVVYEVRGYGLVAGAWDSGLGLAAAISSAAGGSLGVGWELGADRMIVMDAVEGEHVTKEACASRALAAARLAASSSLLRLLRRVDARPRNHPTFVVLTLTNAGWIGLRMRAEDDCVACASISSRVFEGRGSMNRDVIGYRRLAAEGRSAILQDQRQRVFRSVVTCPSHAPVQVGWAGRQTIPEGLQPLLDVFHTVNDTPTLFGPPPPAGYQGCSLESIAAASSPLLGVAVVMSRCGDRVLSSITLRWRAGPFAGVLRTRPPASDELGEWPLCVAVGDGEEVGEDDKNRPLRVVLKGLIGVSDERRRIGLDVAVAGVNVAALNWIPRWALPLPAMDSSDKGLVRAYGAHLPSTTPGEWALASTERLARAARRDAVSRTNEDHRTREVARALRPPQSHTSLASRLAQMLHPTTEGDPALAVEAAWKHAKIASDGAPGVKQSGSAAAPPTSLPALLGFASKGVSIRSELLSRLEFHFDNRIPLPGVAPPSSSSPRQSPIAAALYPLQLDQRRCPLYQSLQILQAAILHMRAVERISATPDRSQRPTPSPASPLSPEDIHLDGALGFLDAWDAELSALFKGELEKEEEEVDEEYFEAGGENDKEEFFEAGGDREDGEFFEGGGAKKDKDDEYFEGGSAKKDTNGEYFEGGGAKKDTDDEYFEGGGAKKDKDDVNFEGGGAKKDKDDEYFEGGGAKKPTTTTTTKKPTATKKPTKMESSKQSTPLRSVLSDMWTTPGGEEDGNGIVLPMLPPPLPPLSHERMLERQREILRLENVGVVMEEEEFSISHPWVQAVELRGEPLVAVLRALVDANPSVKSLFELWECFPVEILPEKQDIVDAALNIGGICAKDFSEKHEEKEENTPTKKYTFEEGEKKRTTTNKDTFEEGEDETKPTNKYTDDEGKKTTSKKYTADEERDSMASGKHVVFPASVWVEAWSVGRRSPRSVGRRSASAMLEGTRALESIAALDESGLGLQLWVCGASTARMVLHKCVCPLGKSARAGGDRAIAMLQDASRHICEITTNLVLSLPPDIRDDMLRERTLAMHSAAHATLAVADAEGIGARTQAAQILFAPKPSESSTPSSIFADYAADPRALYSPSCSDRTEQWTLPPAPDESQAGGLSCTSVVAQTPQEHAILKRLVDLTRTPDQQTASTLHFDPKLPHRAVHTILTTTPDACRVTIADGHIPHQ